MPNIHPSNIEKSNRCTSLLHSHVWRYHTIAKEKCGQATLINVGISELGGMLYASSNEYYQRKHTFKLWVLKDYDFKDSWNEVSSIVDPDIVIASPKYRFADGKVLFWCEHSKARKNYIGHKEDNLVHYCLQ
ncbi:hypothetical protein H5410_054885, partial [Solanum commersonii]